MGMEEGPLNDRASEGLLLPLYEIATEAGLSTQCSLLCTMRF
jgi:hypothetical protein